MTRGKKLAPEVNFFSGSEGTDTHSLDKNKQKDQQCSALAAHFCLLRGLKTILGRVPVKIQDLFLRSGSSKNDCQEDCSPPPSITPFRAQNLPGVIRWGGSFMREKGNFLWRFATKRKEETVWFFVTEKNHVSFAGFI